MSYTLIFTESYLKRAKRFAQRHPELKELYRKTLSLLAHNPYHRSLRLHPLKGKLAMLQSKRSKASNPTIRKASPSWKISMAH